MGIFSNVFEKFWFVIFMCMYFFIMLPLPFFFATQYHPSFWGVPSFIFGWLGHGFFVILLIAIWRHQCMKRREYQEYQK